MIPLSTFGITKEERELLQSRLYPQANKIFLETMAGENGINYGEIQQLDYEDHPSFQMEQWMKKRQLKAKMLNKKIADGYVIPEELCYPYKSIEHAQNEDKKSRHILLKDESTVGQTSKLQFKLEDIPEEKEEKTEL